MKGLELSKLYYKESIYPYFRKELGSVFPYLAFGLVGEGSECFSLDDEISQDHDFDPTVCIWVPNKYKDTGLVEEISKLLTKLPQKFNGSSISASKYDLKGTGPILIEDFFYNYIKQKDFPIENKRWLEIPEKFLATVTNGEVFYDEYGEFSRIRNYLLAHYPSDVLKKKLAAYLANMAQSGQYNMPRCLKRKDIFAFNFARNEFVDACFGVLYLLCGKYKPYYKLVARRLKSFNIYPEKLFDDLLFVQSSTDYSQVIETAEKICNYILELIKYKNYVKTDEKFLIVPAQEIQLSIEDINLRRMNMLEGN